LSGVLLHWEFSSMPHTEINRDSLLWMYETMVTI